MKIIKHIVKFAGKWSILLSALILGFLKFSVISDTHAISGITFSGGASDINSKILCPIASAMFWILMTVSAIMVLYGGFLYVTARADAERVSKAHKTILYAAVGIGVALLAGAFPTVVSSLFGTPGVSVCGGGGGGGGSGAELGTTPLGGGCTLDGECAAGLYCDDGSNTCQSING